ncbi:hypothetical protein B0H19DRAFT_1133916 [Mycena capillaripes]|nr:hypothetical protein B0H19DRAFT_1133916 [Mycena capillaripes]
MSAASYSLMDLPIELLIEITSHYPFPYTPYRYSRPRDKELQRQRREDRLQILRSLSQSCSFLRSAFLPLLWERFYEHRTSFRRDDATPEHLFPYIKSVHMRMVWHRDTRKPVFRFVQFLCALPNLTSLQLDPVGRGLVPTLSYAFSDVFLPTVTTLQTQPWMEAIFPSFRNVKTLTLPSGSFTAVKTSFPHLEAFSGLSVYAEMSLFKGKSPLQPLRCSHALVRLPGPPAPACLGHLETCFPWKCVLLCASRRNPPPFRAVGRV